MNARIRIASIAVAAAGAGALLLAGQSFAAGSTAASTSPRQIFLSTLASKLNVSTSTLKADIQGSILAALQPAVQSGKLTAAQAQGMAQRMSSAGFGPWMKHKGPHGPAMVHRRMGGQHLLYRSMAKVLGMPPNQLRADLKGGTSLSSLLSQKGLSAAQFEQQVSSQVSSTFAKMQSRLNTLEQKALSHVQTEIQKLLTPSTTTGSAQPGA